MEDNGSESFAQLTDRLLPAPISHATWCPTMDLLAAAFTDGRIAVHRLNWQRLWLVTPDAPATALAWTPSGNALAVGRADGVVSLLDAETGDVVDETRFDSSGGVPNLAMALHCDVAGAPVTAIGWRFAGLITNTHIDKSQSFRAAGAVAALTWVEEDDTAAVGVALPQQALQGRARRVCPPPPATTTCKSTTQVLAQICVLVQRRCSQSPTQPVNPQHNLCTTNPIERRDDWSVWVCLRTACIAGGAGWLRGGQGCVAAAAQQAHAARHRLRIRQHPHLLRRPARADAPVARPAGKAGPLSRRSCSRPARLRFSGAVHHMPYTKLKLAYNVSDYFFVMLPHWLGTVH